MIRDADRTTRSTEQPIRITTAAASHNADIARRQKRYLASMSLRSICFAGALVTPSPYRWFLIAGALILPYIAVVMANATATRKDGFELLDSFDNRPQLSAGHSEPVSERA